LAGLLRDFPYLFENVDRLLPVEYCVPVPVHAVQAPEAAIISWRQKPMQEVRRVLYGIDPSAVFFFKHDF
jgi:hypothetical protein